MQKRVAYFFANYSGIISLLVWGVVCLFISNGVKIVNHALRSSQHEVKKKIRLYTDWRFYDIRSGLPGSNVFSFCKNPKGGFFLIMDKGWCHWEVGNIRNFSKPGGHLPAAIATNNAGETWGTSGNDKRFGLFRIERSIKRNVLGEDFNWAVYVGNNGDIWFGSRFPTRVSRIRQNIRTDYDPGKIGEVAVICSPDDKVIYALGQSRCAKFDGNQWNIVSNIGIGHWSKKERPLHGMDHENNIWIKRAKNIVVIIDNHGAVREFDSLERALDSLFPMFDRDVIFPVNTNCWSAIGPDVVICRGKVRIHTSWYDIKPLSEGGAGDICGVYVDSGKVYFFTNKGIFIRNSIHFCESSSDLSKP